MKEVIKVRTFKSRSHGFTLIEILMVVVIIGTLAAMLIPRLTGRSEQARYAAAKADVNVNIATALKLYELDNGFFPTTDQGLEALIRKPTIAPFPPNWNGPYLENPPTDPWGKPYSYRCPGVNRPHDYDLLSSGKNPAKDKVEDDITNWVSAEEK